MTFFFLYSREFFTTVACDTDQWEYRLSNGISKSCKPFFYASSLLDSGAERQWCGPRSYLKTSIRG